jgi:uracil-DNA glycosylase
MPDPAPLDEVSRRLHQAHPDARYELDWDTPLQLLVATILAAQCTDERVNQVTPELFARYHTARDFAEADTGELEGLIRGTGYYRQKAKSIQGCCREIADRFGGQVPRDIDDLITLPGVARKTANVVLNTAFRIPSGVIVDTHVARVSQRLGLSASSKPEEIEQDLMAGLPKGEWVTFGPAMVLHGRYTCTSSNPRCGDCVLEDICPKISVGGSPAPAKSPRPSGGKTLPAKGSSGKSSAAKSSAGGAAGPAMSAQALPASWRAVLADELRKPYFQDLDEFVRQERAEHEVFPPPEDVFNAFVHTPYDEVKVLLLGQDPYHDNGQAHGLCFSVRPGVKPPPSLVNMFKELEDDLGIPPPNHGCLTAWADQGVMLLNAVLTVRAHTPNSHKDKGWERFTDAVIRKVSDKDDPVVFVLWGSYAQKKEKLIDTDRHTVIKSAHPSPLSARNGFFGSKPYSTINKALEQAGRGPIDWRLEDM